MLWDIRHFTLIIFRTCLCWRQGLGSECYVSLQHFSYYSIHFFPTSLVFFPLGAKNWRSCPSSAAVPTSSFKNLVSNQVLKYSILLSWFELQIFLRHYTHTHKHTHYVFCLFICSPGLSYECGICSLVALICLLFKSHCVYLNCKYLFEKFV